MSKQSWKNDKRTTLAVSVAPAGRTTPVGCSLLVAFVCALSASHAHAAAACDAPWMHEGGGFSLTSSPSHRTTDFTVTRFVKHDGDNCSGQVHAKTTLSMGGQAMQSESDVKFEIANSKSHVESETVGGTLNSHAGEGAFAASMTGQSSASVFSYIGEITGEGQHLPGMRSEGAMSGAVSNGGVNVGNLAAQKIVTTTTDKQVGKQEQLDTPIGKFACWPVSYDKTMAAGNVQAMSHTTNINAVTHVVDHFCPSAGLVMRQDMTINGRANSLAISALH